MPNVAKTCVKSAGPPPVSRYTELKSPKVQIIDKMVEGGLVSKSNPQALSDFSGIVRIKDSVAEFMWHFLVGCVDITTAYNNMMNTVCQKAVMTDVEPLNPTPTSTPGPPAPA